MNRAALDRIANAVLYEGYILYPYRPSVKNRQRWTFGGVYPEAYCASTKGSDSSTIQSEILVEGTRDTTIEATARFLRLTSRQVGRIDPPLEEWPAEGEPDLQMVPSMQVDGQVHHGWQEAEECETALEPARLGDLEGAVLERRFSLPGKRRLEPVCDSSGAVVGTLVREQCPIEVKLQAQARQAAQGLFQITLRLGNDTALESGDIERNDALLHSLASAHLLLGVDNGRFVSLTDPPEKWKAQAAACSNVGAWPVLVGAEGERDTMLSAPIILYDYPQVAPESPGDLFDGLEIDEILTLRILTLTDEEKLQVAAVDERARALLARTQALGPEQLLAMHGMARPEK